MTSSADETAMDAPDIASSDSRREGPMQRIAPIFPILSAAAAGGAWWAAGRALDPALALQLERGAVALAALTVLIAGIVFAAAVRRRIEREMDAHREATDRTLARFAGDVREYVDGEVAAVQDGVEQLRDGVLAAARIEGRIDDIEAHMVDRRAADALEARVFEATADVVAEAQRLAPRLDLLLDRQAGTEARIGDLAAVREADRAWLNEARTNEQAARAHGLSTLRADLEGRIEVGLADLERRIETIGESAMRHRVHLDDAVVSLLARAPDPAALREALERQLEDGLADNRRVLEERVAGLRGALRSMIGDEARTQRPALPAPSAVDGEQRVALEAELRSVARAVTDLERAETRRTRLDQEWGRVRNVIEERLAALEGSLSDVTERLGAEVEDRRHLAQAFDEALGAIQAGLDALEQTSAPEERALGEEVARLERLNQDLRDTVERLAREQTEQRARLDAVRGGGEAPPARERAHPHLVPVPLRPAPMEPAAQ